MVLQDHFDIVLQFLEFPHRQNFLVSTFRILHHSGKILSAKWIRKIGFWSYGCSVKLSFSTINSVKLIFGGMGIQINRISVKSILKNDRESYIAF